MRKPVSDWTTEEMAQPNPVALIKVKAINKDNTVTDTRAKLQQPQLPLLRLQLERFNVKAN